MSLKQCGAFGAFVFCIICAPLYAEGQATTTDATTTPAVSATTTPATTTPEATIPAPVTSNAEVEAVVRAAFSNVPIMIEIARCESRFTQFGKGGALHGGAGGAMVGTFQVHETVHRTFAASIGMDIDTLEGNILYAKYLYDHEGTRPWVSSFSCWGAASSPESNATHEQISSTAGAFTANLSLGTIHPEVLLLQKILNDSGIRLADSGPGSPGNETTKFGSLTRAAVQKFQCHQKIACGGDEHSTGYGFVGPRTRTALMQLQGSNIVVADPTPTADPTAVAEYSPAQMQEIERLKTQIEMLKTELARLAARTTI